MKNNLRIVAVRLIPALLVVVLCGGSLNARINLQEDSQTRRLWDSEFVKAKKTAPAKRRYRVATPRIPTNTVDGESVLGITLWRLRPSKVADDKEVRLFKHKKDNTSVTEWTPERISVDPPLSVGRIIDIPALDDEPNYFTLDPDRPGLAGEVISVLVTPQPLADIKIGEEAVILSKSEVEKWEKEWGAQVGRLDLENSFGQTWTKEERDATKGQTLKRDSPAPHTLYYRPAAKPGDSLMVSVRLRYGVVKARLSSRQEN
jgi:hypothetical protein